MSDETPLLIDPDRARLAAAFAAIAAGARTGAYLDYLEMQMAERPEGTAARQLGSRQNQPVEASWWTDHQGRRQVRLQRATGGPPSRWHPLGRVHPGVLVKVGERWVALCRCGEAGPPQRLAWMGPWCGPCHDRAEEGAPLPEPYPAVQAMPRPLSWLAWGAGGASLYASTQGFDVMRLDLDRGRWSPAGDWKGVTTWTRNSLVPSPTDPGRAALYDTDRREVRLLDDAARLVQALSVGREASQPPALAFSPDGQVLAFAGGTAGWRLWRKGANGFELHLRQDSFASEVAFSPDGTKLALRGLEGSVVRLADATTGLTSDFFRAASGARLAGYALGGKCLALIGWHYEQSVQVWRLSPPGVVCQIPLHHCQEARVTPCQRYLLWCAVDDNSLRLSCLSTGELVASVSADPVVGVLAFAWSADGVWLALSDSRANLRIIRWPALLAEMLAAE